MITVAEFAQKLEAAIAKVRPELVLGLAELGKHVQPMAAEYIGREMPEWPPLKPATIAEKAAAGYPTPAPLLRTGEMRDSIKPEVDPIELELALGSEDLVALWQEMGTSRGIPPRPFLALAMKNGLPYAEEIFGEAAVKILTGRRP